MREFEYLSIGREKIRTKAGCDGVFLERPKNFGSMDYNERYGYLQLRISNQRK